MNMHTNMSYSAAAKRQEAERRLRKMPMAAPEKHIKIGLRMILAAFCCGSVASAIIICLLCIGAK
jgi:hypothetical protein